MVAGLIWYQYRIRTYAVGAKPSFRIFCNDQQDHYRPARLRSTGHERVSTVSSSSFMWVFLFLTVLQAAGIRAIEFDSGTGCSDVDNIPRATASTRSTVGQPCPKQCTIRTHLVAKFSHLVRRRMYSWFHCTASVPDLLCYIFTDWYQLTPDWYDVNATAFQIYLETFYCTFRRPLWITEWACQNYNNANAQCSDQAISEFMNQTQMFMDQSSFVERYAWFGAMEQMQGVNSASDLCCLSFLGNLTAAYGDRVMLWWIVREKLIT